MTKDIGIVFLPNSECSKFAGNMTRETKKFLSEFEEAQNTPHITAIHIANLDEKSQQNMHTQFLQYFANLKQCIKLPILGIKATGGNAELGYKWLDLQFETLPELANLRSEIVDKFCPFHNGILTRMNDDIANFSIQQMADIKKCGVTFSSYLPHITAWYIDLPKEAKQTKLQEVADSFAGKYDDLKCYIESVALVELGRNGNVIDVIKTLSLCQTHDEL